MKKILFVLVVLASVVGCSTPQEKALAWQSKLVARMSYFQDPRSYVCYSYLAATEEGEAESFTAVPCTAEVRALLPSYKDPPLAPAIFQMDEAPKDGVIVLF